MSCCDAHLCEGVMRPMVELGSLNLRLGSERSWNQSWYGGPLKIVWLWCASCPSENDLTVQSSSSPWSWSTSSCKHGFARSFSWMSWQCACQLFREAPYLGLNLHHFHCWLKACRFYCMWRLQRINAACCPSCPTLHSSQCLCFGVSANRYVNLRIPGSRWIFLS